MLVYLLSYVIKISFKTAISSLLKRQLHPPTQEHAFFLLVFANLSACVILFKNHIFVPAGEASWWVAHLTER